MDLYPPGPEQVPPDLTRPTRAYRRHAWLAFAGLVLFVGIYLGLTGWLGWTAWRLVADAHAAGNLFVGGLLALPAAFLFVFLVKGLFFVKQTEDPGLIELDPSTEPDLFAFVHRIADQAGAPRPHRVFVSSRVNAAVFYELSLLNLVFPSKKNLEIGLGLVEALTLDELKAVVAHEFGHFAQRTMAIGRWLYVSQQVVGHVVGQRDAFDRFLEGLSRFDLRVAWIGWLMRLVVWSLRAVIDTGFRLIALAQRALSREMELQADLVAVSLTGSDSLVHALHRLHAADDAWGRALSFAEAELRAGRVVDDLFAVQRHIQDKLAHIRDDPEYGVPPARPEPAAPEHRVFRADLAQPPRMWSTHPPNREREDNAKRTYLPSVLDGRSAWGLFADPEGTRRRMTRHVLSLVAEAEPDALPDETLPTPDALAVVDEHFDRPHLHRRYRGAYLGRSVVLHAEAPAALFGDLPEGASVVEALDALYPDALADELERWRELEEELALIEALADGFLEAPGGVIRHRGAEIDRKELPFLVDEVRTERDVALQVVLGHDRACRTAHRAAARQLGAGWEEHLEGLVALLHYAEHAAADLEDAAGHLGHVFGIVTVDGKISSSELLRLISACDDLQRVLEEVYEVRDAVGLCAPVAERLEIDAWPEALPDALELHPPTQENIGSWLEVHESWVRVVGQALRGLGGATLQVLLQAEEHVATCLREGVVPEPAPTPASAPPLYTTRAPGTERERQKRLGWWDRFLVADGLLPGAARFSVAFGVLALPALMMSAQTGSASGVVLNGLAIPVQVSVGGEEGIVPAHGTWRVDLPARGRLHVRAATLDDREIEAFTADTSNTWVEHVYNVAGATALVEWTAVYGNVAERPERRLGAPRWSVSSADHVFAEPPSSVSSSGSGASRDVLTALTGEGPAAQWAMVEEEAEWFPVALAHLRWDPTAHPHFLQWAAAASADPRAREVVADRLEDEEDDPVLLRLEQELAGEDAEVICARRRALADERPDAVGLRYLAARCLPLGDERDAAMAAAHRDLPGDPWLAMHVGFERAREGDWDEALALIEPTRDAIPAAWGGFATDLARIRRAAAPDPAAVPLDDLVAISEHLRWLLTLEQEAGEQPPADLSALPALPPDELDRATACAGLALAAREGRALEPWKEAMAGLFRQDELDALRPLADVEALRADPTAADHAVRGLDPELRGHARVMGRILLGADAPPAWQAEARALLFATERRWLP